VRITATPSRAETIRIDIAMSGLALRSEEGGPRCSRRSSRNCSCGRCRCSRRAWSRSPRRGWPRRSRCVRGSGRGDDSSRLLRAGFRVTLRKARRPTKCRGIQELPLSLAPARVRVSLFRRLFWPRTRVISSMPLAMRSPSTIRVSSRFFPSLRRS